LGIHTLLKECGYPKQAFVSIGATAYADFGEKNYLKDGDEVIVEAYDKNDPLRNVILTQKVKNPS